VKPPQPPAATAKPGRLTALADLKQVQRALREQAAQRASQAAEQKAAQARADAGKNLFLQAAGAVQPLQSKHRVLLKKEQIKPAPRTARLDEDAAPPESASDGFDASTLLDIDGQTSFRRPGIGSDVIAKLRRGNWTIQARLDLHGLRSDGARERLGQFLREARVQGLRCVRIVHGKGLGSAGQVPVLKRKVQGWLVQTRDVLAFVQARPADGGDGALVVLLQAD
jgi:DNA-nicking Smr family endonuclease